MRTTHQGGPKWDAMAVRRYKTAFSKYNASAFVPPECVLRTFLDGEMVTFQRQPQWRRLLAPMRFLLIVILWVLLFWA
jgi:hypothetical protein